MQYTNHDEWLRQDGDVVTVGISTYAAGELGDIVFIELPAEGAEVTEGDEVVTIESVKTATGIAAPFDGTITQVNQTVADDPASVNLDPMGQWFFRIRPVDQSALAGFIDEETYNSSH